MIWEVSKIHQYNIIHDGGKCCTDDKVDDYDGNGGFRELADMLWR